MNPLYNFFNKNYQEKKFYYFSRKHYSLLYLIYFLNKMSYQQIFDEMRYNLYFISQSELFFLYNHNH